MRAGVEVKASYWPALLVVPGPLIPKVALSVDLRNMEWPQSSKIVILQELIPAM